MSAQAYTDRIQNWGLAQLVERMTVNHDVAGSSPVSSVWNFSSVGRALGWSPRGRWFKSSRFHSYNLAPLEQRSARRPVTAKVTGSNPVWCVIAEELPPDKMSWNLYYCRTRAPRPLFCDKNTRGKRNWVSSFSKSTLDYCLCSDGQEIKNVINLLVVDYWYRRSVKLYPHWSVAKR